MTFNSCPDCRREFPGPTGATDFIEHLCPVTEAKAVSYPADSTRILLDARQYIIDVPSPDPFYRVSERDLQGDLEALDILNAAFDAVREPWLAAEQVLVSAARCRAATDCAQHPS